VDGVVKAHFAEVGAAAAVRVVAVDKAGNRGNAALVRISGVAMPLVGTLDCQAVALPGEFMISPMRCAVVTRGVYDSVLFSWEALFQDDELGVDYELSLDGEVIFVGPATEVYAHSISPGKHDWAVRVVQRLTGVELAASTVRQFTAR
jgi:hypothetical protein